MAFGISGLHNSVAGFILEILVEVLPANPQLEIGFPDRVGHRSYDHVEVAIIP